MGDRVSLSLAFQTITLFHVLFMARAKEQLLAACCNRKSFKKKYMSNEKRERFEGKLKKLVTIAANIILGKILSRK